MSFHEQLRAARVARGINQSFMAKQLGVDKTTYSGYETGRRQPDIIRLRQIIKLLDVSADGLLETGTSGGASPEELSMLRKFRLLDVHGREMTGLVLDKEYERMTMSVLRKEPQEDESRGHIAYINCYDLAVSAGTGEPWGDTAYKNRLEIPGDMVPSRADFCVRVNGNSMEPAYRDGDIVFVERVEGSVAIGEIGIFFLNGDGYIKRLGEGQLVSLNPEYQPIKLNEFDNLLCQGRVLGKL